MREQTVTEPINLKNSFFLVVSNEESKIKLDSFSHQGNRVRLSIYFVFDD